MGDRVTVTRRGFLRLMGLTTGVVALAACQAAPAPPAAPVKPAEPAKPTAVAAKPAEAKPTEPAKPVEAAKPTAAVAPKPTDTEAKIGASLIGKLEGPEVLPDAKRPPKLGEAPMLAELVKQGKLLPVEERVPEEPLVIKPVHEIGKYGGTWRRGFTGPGDGENGNRVQATDRLVNWDYTGTKMVPGVARAWEVSDNSQTYTFHLRKGHKWSDGHPFTADDYVFWWEEILLNKELTPTPTAELTVDGKLGTLEKVSETTFRLKFSSPYPLFPEVIGGSGFIGGAHSMRGDAFGGLFAPSHYLKQFHPKYTPQDQIDKLVADGKFDNWVSLFRFKNTWRLNLECPVLTPWRSVTPINTPTWNWERNPYYYAVDTEGNQLPYIDKVSLTLAENLEVLNLRAIAGEYDWQERHTGLSKLPIFLENQEKANYKVYLDPASNGSECVYYLNQSYEGDPEVAKWLRNKDVRHALSLGIDRDQLNEAFWLGVGSPGSVAPAPGTIYSPGEEWRKKWSTFDLKQANELLDKAGLTQKDSEGYRQRTDGKGRLRFEVVTVAAAFVPTTQISEMVAQHWKRIGIQADILEQERSLIEKRIVANEMQMGVFGNDGSDFMFGAGGFVLPVQASGMNSQIGPAYVTWYASAGAQGTKPWDPEMVRGLELFRKAQGQETQERTETGKEIWRIVVEETWGIGTVGLSPAVLGVRVVKNTMGNVPARELNSNYVRTPSSSHPSTLFFKS